MSSLYRLPKPKQISVFSRESSTESSQSPSQCSDEESHSNRKTVKTPPFGTGYGQYFECVRIANDGSVVIASDNLQGTHINGYITKFASITDVPHAPLISLDPEFGGCANLLSTRDHRYICGFDSGHIILLNDGLDECSSAASHDHHITSLSLNKLENKFLSVSMDMSMIIWDYETFTPIRLFPNAHSQYIWSAQFNAIDDNMIVSSGDDRNVLLWDIRMGKPASQLAKCKFIPSCVCWTGNDTSQAYVGTYGGQLFVFDARRPLHEISSRVVTSNRLHRIKNVLSKTVAICADDSDLYLYDAERLQLIYRDSAAHTDWVRDVCEHNGMLYTVGRDTKLVLHSYNN